MLFLQQEQVNNKKTNRVLKVSTPNVKNIYTWSGRLSGIQVGKFSHLILKTGILCIACSIFAKINRFSKDFSVPPCCPIPSQEDSSETKVS